MLDPTALCIQKLIDTVQLSLGRCTVPVQHTAVQHTVQHNNRQEAKDSEVIPKPSASEKHIAEILHSVRCENATATHTSPTAGLNYA